MKRREKTSNSRNTQTDDQYQPTTRNNVLQSHDKSKHSNISNRKAQVTLFIIIGIVIALVIITYFIISGNFTTSTVPKEFEPIYTAYIDCLDSQTKQAAQLMGQQAGYITPPEFIPGSSYRPFSNQLNFLNQPVPYWLTVSGNNQIIEQVPSKDDMQEELEEYLQERLDLCDFSEYQLQGYEIYIEDGNVNINIKDDTIDVTASNPITLYYGNDSARVNQHKYKTQIRLGALYNQAKEIYEYEKTNNFLEKYTIDTLRLHAPVDGVELTCTPIIFNDEKIRVNITQGLVANINKLKIKGDYYIENKNENGYFVVNPGSSTDAQNAQIIYNPTWPTRIEIFGDKVAQPIGLQEGLSIMGFCYTPYHLVYDINYPVLIQLFDNDFFFQFPVAVLVEKNNEREAINTTTELTRLDSPICQYQNQQIQINTYDQNLNPLPARIQFKCLQTTCEIGSSELTANSATYNGAVPQCINGEIIASAPGYATTTQTISTNEEAIADIILSKIYTIPVDLGNINGNAVVTFTGENQISTIYYPQTKTVEIAQGQYNISVQVFRNSSLYVEGINQERCVDVPADGLSGVLGITKEQCNYVEVPGMQVDSALVGGGKTVDYFTESQLEKTKEINLNIELFPTPTTLEELQQTYTLVQGGVVNVILE